MMISTENFAQVQISSPADLRTWLEANHAQQESVWLVTYKKNVPDKYVSTQEVLDELLCFGWIDGIRRKLDEERTMQLISPRRVEHWAKTYKDRAAKLIADGKMHTAGFRSIEVAKQNGLWDFMDDVDQLIEPADLRAALDQQAHAAVFFDGINPSSKRFVLRWLKLAKTDKTRQSRIEQLVALSAKGEKLKGS
ncbi:YdeI/OmpD-associated family protein [Penaeicola halotolerans]|uniref:YdeI/OmpD-associated family protein n=1 Tax=Penaeicola halotolerans TaxID=2793196 RepID=UPI001CF8272E|nr:YdeI/OmpD-associated family protein [Penaeicola halotolerans]